MRAAVGDAGLRVEKHVVRIKIGELLVHVGSRAEILHTSQLQVGHKVKPSEVVFAASKTRELSLEAVPVVELVVAGRIGGKWTVPGLHASVEATKRIEAQPRQGAEVFACVGELGSAQA